jgi:hypothetical protein
VSEAETRVTDMRRRARGGRAFVLRPAIAGAIDERPRALGEPRHGLRYALRTGSDAPTAGVPGSRLDGRGIGAYLLLAFGLAWIPETLALARGTRFAAPGAGRSGCW